VIDIAARSPHRLRALLGLAGFAVLMASSFAIYRAVGERGAAPEATPQTAVGWSHAPQEAPNLRFIGGDGKPYTLADFRGKLVLLNVWATWCVPCRKEMPALDRLQQQLGGANFQVVALSIDGGGTPAVRRFYDEIGIRALAVFVDSNMEATGKLRTLGIPTTLLLDREGRERWRRAGPAEWDSPEIVAALRERLRSSAD
jgi:thiol-disulfide isomerase/thioredoxin